MPRAVFHIQRARINHLAAWAAAIGFAIIAAIVGAWKTKGVS